MIGKRYKLHFWRTTQIQGLPLSNGVNSMGLITNQHAATSNLVLRSLRKRNPVELRTMRNQILLRNSAQTVMKGKRRNRNYHRTQTMTAIRTLSPPRNRTPEGLETGDSARVIVIQKVIQVIPIPLVPSLPETKRQESTVLMLDILMQMTCLRLQQIPIFMTN
ncbi:hypothetical protein BF17_18200 [Yersinia similis]|uniref:Uncharacterized protein n=1 Tax=Yersinia similis TaxID=367190 RepID=A0ABN4CXC4_9GAMM|nr:hypothetical protein BF17_18200 [Yersinia similis]